MGNKPVTSAPGLAFKTLLRHSKATDRLMKIVGQPVIEVLKGLDPNLISSEKIGELAAELVDPSEALRKSSTRDEIINLLPLPKARELAQRLGIEEKTKDLFVNLHKAASNKTALHLLFSFFGVMHDTYVPENPAEDKSILSPSYGLFPHQRVAAERVHHLLCKPPRKAILHMPTGSGKTRTAMQVVVNHLRARESALVCWLAHNAELLEQASSEFEKAWNCLGNRRVELMRFWGNRSTDIMSASDGLIFAGLGKMHAFDNRDPNSVLRLADRVSLVVIDEAHQAIAPTYASILSALYTKRPNTALLGLTATPGRTWSDIEEDQKLSDFFDGIKVTLEVDGHADPVSFLIQEGYLARPHFHTLNFQAGLELSSGDIKELSNAVDVPDKILERLGADTQSNLKIVSGIEDLLERHSRIIVFAPSVESARLLVAILTVRGHEAYVVVGGTSVADRRRVFRRFRSNNSRPMVLCNYGVLTAGFDAPQISAALIARPTRSLVLYSQMVGRATRGPKAGGNAEAEILTVIDPCLPSFGSIVDAFKNWEDIWNEYK